MSLSADELVAARETIQRGLGADITSLQWVVNGYLLMLGALMLVIDPGALMDAALRPDFQVFAALMGLVYYLELVVWFYAVRHIDVSLASSITTPWPAFTMVLAALVLGDRIEPYQIVTFVVVAACIYGLTWAGLRKARRSELLQQ